MTPSDRRAFTLLELLVALTVTAVLCGMMTAAAMHALRLWTQQQAEQGATIAAHQVFDLLERDLQSLASPRGGEICFAADIVDAPAGLANHGWRFGPGPGKTGGVEGLRPLPPPDDAGQVSVAAARFGLSGVWLRFIATNVESGGGLPVAISYQVVRRPVTGNPVAANPAPIRYGLYRSAVSATETFNAGYEVTAAAYGSASNTPSGALSTAYRLARNVTNPSHANLLAANVIDFGCWLYARDATGALVRLFPASAADTSHHATGDGSAADSRPPDAVDVMVRILDPDGATALEALESGAVARPPAIASDAEWWWSVAMAHSRVFVRRIEVGRPRS